MSKRSISKCPECGEILEVDSYSDIGDHVVCHSCDAELEIIGLDPVRYKILREYGDADEVGYPDEYAEDSEDFYS